MKMILSFLCISVLSLSSQAATRYGHECGLIDSADDFQLEPVVSKSLHKKSRLTSLQKKQILAASEPGMTSPKAALIWLIESSEAGDVYYETGEFDGGQYDIVRYYPGGNPYGTIFLRGSDVPVADIRDSDIVCR